MSKINNISGLGSEMGIIEPLERIKHLANYGNLVDVDINVPIRR